MSVIICLLWTVSTDDDIQSDINQIIMHFVRSVRKNDNMNCEFKERFSCMALQWLIYIHKVSIYSFFYEVI